MSQEPLEWISVGKVDDLPEGRVKTVTARPNNAEQSVTKNKNTIYTFTPKILILSTKYIFSNATCKIPQQ